MTLERLWAGWRADLFAAPTEPGCLFERLAATRDDESLIVERAPLTFTVMNLYPYTSGHLMVAPFRHEPDLERLSDDEAAALIAATQRATAGVKAAFGAPGVNVGMNLGRAAGAGIPAHLHVHVVPRWDGDTNFMTSVAEARVLPESLPATWEKLRAAWPA